MATSTAGRIATKRRNGQLSSCEPCRKAKLRCDHAMPICGRCAQRDRQNECIYHPAPLTQPRQPVENVPLNRKRKREPSILTEKGITSTSFLQRYRMQPTHHDHSHDEEHDDYSSRDSQSQGAIGPEKEPLRVKTKSALPTGFLGPSSFWAAFDDPEDNRVSSTIVSTAYPTPTQSMGHSSSPIALNNSALEEHTAAYAEQIECGARILVLLEDLPLYKKIVEYRYTNSEVEPWVFGRDLVEAAFAGIYPLRQEWKQGSKLSQKKLLAWSEKLFENSAKPIITHQSMTMNEYFSSIAARWDTIGLIFLWLATAAFLVPEGHDVLRLDDGSIVDIQKLKLLAIEISDICLDFCDSVEILSDPLVLLLLQRVVLHGEVHGAGDYKSWKKLGDLTTIIFALGLHCPKQDPSVPFFLTQIRLRAMAACFSLDKQLATVLGRPPRISWQYCALQHPVDLSYKEICAISEGKEHLEQKIGPDGWNLEGKLTTGTRGRLNVMLGVIREKILMLSLSPHTEDLIERLSATCAEHEKIRASLPPKLQWKLLQSMSNNNNACCPVSTSTITVLQNLHLDFLHNDFILYSVLAKCTGGSKEKLIDSAREMLSNLLEVVSSRHPASLQNSYRSSWDLCYIGLPCAGVLAQELLQRSRARVRSRHSSNVNQPLLSKAQFFPRSAIIQNLSVFASLLENALHAGDGTYEIGRRGLDAIRSILDRVLGGEMEVETAAGTEVTSSPHTQNNSDGNYNGGSLIVPLPDQFPGLLSPDQQHHQQHQHQHMTESSSSIAATAGMDSSTAFKTGIEPGVPGTGAEYALDDGILSLDLMAWLDNFDWAQESLLNYS